MNVPEISNVWMLVPLVAILTVLVFAVLKLCLRIATIAGVLKDDGAKRKRMNVVCACVALIGAVFLLWMGLRSQEMIAMGHRSDAFCKAIRAGLENYHSEYGEYPAPIKGEVHVVMDGHDYEASGALMLYQALTGDGNDRLKVANATSASDGKVTGDEITRAFLKEMPAEMWSKTEVGWMLVDGFGHPFQYTKGGPDSVNASYDLWSFGESAPPDKVDKAGKQSVVAEKWIKNW